MDRRPEQIFFQRRYTDGQQTHEKMLNTAYYQRTVTSNNNEISPHTSEWLCYHKKRPQKTSIVKDVWRRQWQPTPVLLPGKSHGQGSLVGYSPWGRKESDTIEQLHFHFSLSCIGEGNGNPLQCSCLENPRDGGAWWAAVYGVAQSRTRLT